MNTMSDHKKTVSKGYAVVGMGCRFPSADDPNGFWTVMRDGVDAISEIPGSRWDVDAFFDPNPGEPGKMYTRWGGFIKNPDHFDALFFNISPSEAKAMDPQQRLLMEVTWEALENAGQSPDGLSGSNTGVFIGISSNDYFRVQRTYTGVDAYSGTGNAFSTAANRLSYFLDLKGPSFAIDSACSSSLVAVHQACRALDRQECAMAIVGGVNLILSPDLHIVFSRSKMMASDGRCKTFDASADGYVRGEGCGVVIIKRLSDAIKNRDNILAVVRGSAVNQDGRSSSLTAPNGPSQEKVIHAALEDAEIKPDDINYVEAHGTGTALGDPVEVEALKNVLADNREFENPCWIGSVKTNIGHLESAAGIAGMIKVILCLQNKKIPPNLHFNKLNPEIPIKGTPLKIATVFQDWQCHNNIRMAGVSSFGFGGTNAHVILEEAPLLPEDQPAMDCPVHFFTLSAKNENALKASAKRFEQYLLTKPDISLADVCHTVNTGRSHFKYRLAVQTDSQKSLCSALSSFSRNEQSNDLVYGQVTARRLPKTAFLFTGQGSQYSGMGKDLYSTYTVFKNALDKCNEILTPYLGCSLIKVMFSDDKRLNDTLFTQPALFSLEYALFQLWASWGIHPSAVMGHSVGEYVAACVAGVFSLEDGLKMIAHRGRLIQALPRNGAMAAVLTTTDQVRSAVAPYEGAVSIAAYNSPESHVISGEAKHVEAACRMLQKSNIKTVPLQVSHAFHSPLMEPVISEFHAIASGVDYHEPKIAIISNITGNNVDEEMMSPDYWCGHILAPVRFFQSVEKLSEMAYTLFLECGPIPILSGMARQCPSVETAVFLPSLHKNRNDYEQMLKSLQRLYVMGMPINWAGLDQGYPRKKQVLPCYPFQRQQYWFDRVEAKDEKNVESLKKIETPKQKIHHINLNDAVVWLTGKVSEYTGVSKPDIRTDISFSDIGLTSIDLINIHSEIKQYMDIDLPTSVIQDCPDIQSLASAMTGDLNIQAPDLRKDVVLDESIVFKPIVEAGTAENRKKNILVTGATGFLGIFLLRELINKTEANIFCLTRASDQQAGINRLKEKIEEFHILDCDLNANVRVLPGDLSLERLGLDENTYSELAGVIDAVYHCGATVDWVKPYASLKKTNVSGTVEVIKFAGFKKTKPLHYVSSLAVLPSLSDKFDWFEGDLPEPESLTNGYSQSKWVAEMICNEARKRGLPVNIYRFDYVVGTETTGAMKNTDFIVRMIKGCIQLGCIPIEDTNFDILPVDYLSKIIVAISMEGENINKNYHLINRKPFLVSDFVSLIREFGYKIERIPFKDWKALVKKSSSSVLYPLFPFLDKYGDAQLAYYYNSIVDNTNTLTALYKIDPELIDTISPARDVMKQVMRFFIDTGHLPLAHEKGMLDRQSEYWERQLYGAPSQLELPKNKLLTINNPDRYGTESFFIDDNTFQNITELSDQSGINVSEILLTAFKLLLCRYTGQVDIPVALPVAVQLSPEKNQEKIFIPKVMIIRTIVPKCITFKSLLFQIRQIVLEAYANMDVPSAETRGLLYTENQPEDRFRYDALFSYYNEIDTGEDRINSHPLSFNGVSYPQANLALNFEVANNELKGHVKYDSHMFPSYIIKNMTCHIRNILNEVSLHPTADIFKIPIMTKEASDRILHDWNKSGKDYSQNICIHHKFMEQAAATPDATAVVCGDRSLTYRELDNFSNRVAQHLGTLGAGPDTLVGLCVERNIEMVVGILGILKSGSAYVPLDPAYPSERLAFILDDARVSILLTQQDLEASLPSHAACVVHIDNLDKTSPSDTTAMDKIAHRKVSPENLAYVIYTSGSTGKPKGVLVTHANVMRLFNATDSWFHFGEEDVWTLFHSFAFDFSVWELWGALLYGGRLVVVPHHISRSPQEFYNLLVKEQVTILNQTPSAFLQLIRAEEVIGRGDNLSLRLIIFGGEALNLQMLKPWIERHGDRRPQLVNMYGITETTVHVTYRPITKDDIQNHSGSVIGIPIPDLRLYVLDQNLQPVPVGIAGEMYVGGGGVSRGYLNRPELNGERFIPDPFTNSQSEILYKTGDVGRYLPNGELEYLGRADQQLQVHGFRVEPGEIEMALSEHDAVSQSVVIFKEIQPGDQRLIAYFISTSDEMTDARELRSHLQEKLPVYMIPQYFVNIDHFPLTPNGKIDHAALPNPLDVKDNDSCLLPSTSIESQLVEIWKNILKIDRIGINDNFLELGGNSILAMKLLIQLKEIFGVDLTIQGLFDNFTIAGLGETIINIHNNGYKLDDVKSNANDLKADAVCDIDFDLSKLEKASAIPEEIKRIFLTGATGYLGAYLLQNILEQASADVYCLVRAKTASAGTARIKGNLEKYSLWQDDYSDRIKPVIGDLVQPKLGISEEIFEFLAKNIDAIYHNGCVVNFSYPYKFLKKPNVGGTKEVLKLAVYKKVKPLFYVSTQGVFESSGVKNRLILETKNLPDPDGLFYGYSQSKWVAEKIVSLAAEKGMPVTIFRPGSILGDSRNGAANLEDIINFTLKAFTISGAVPDFDFDVYGAPVDHVASAIVKISLNPNAIGEVFHLVHPSPASVRQLIDYFMSFGYELPVLPFKKWMSLLMDAVKNDDFLLPFLPVITNETSLMNNKTYFEMQAESSRVFSIDNTLKFIEDFSTTCPPMDEKLFHLYLSYLEEIDFISKGTNSD